MHVYFYLQPSNMSQAFVQLTKNLPQNEARNLMLGTGLYRLEFKWLLYYGKAQTEFFFKSIMKNVNLIRNIWQARGMMI